MMAEETQDVPASAIRHRPPPLNMPEKFDFDDPGS